MIRRKYDPTVPTESKKGGFWLVIIVTNGLYMNELQSFLQHGKKQMC